VAVAHGYAPRVRDKLGIKWSSERGQPVMAFGMVAVMAAWAMAMTAATATFGEIAMLPSGALALVLVWGVLRTWRRAMYLPLVLERAALPAPVSVTEDTAVGEAAGEAHGALERLRTAIDEDAPQAARSDLLRTHAELVERVTELQRQASALVLEPSGAIAALRDRLARLDPDDEATAVERASLQEALDDEAAALHSAEARHSAVLTELLGVRRTVREAVADLQADDPERDPTASLRSQVSALRSATDEARDRAQRAQRARGGPQRQ
jgi:hypothetical protein